MDSSVHAVDGCTESHGLGELVGCRQVCFSQRVKSLRQALCSHPQFVTPPLRGVGRHRSPKALLRADDCLRQRGKTTLRCLLSVVRTGGRTTNFLLFSAQAVACCTPRASLPWGDWRRSGDGTGWQGRPVARSSRGTHHDPGPEGLVSQSLLLGVPQGP